MGSAPLLTTIEAAHALREGAVLAIPTDTVYGLACDPSNAVAVDRIYAIKGRPASLELTLMGGTWEDVRKECIPTPEAELLAAAYLPGPLALVLPVQESRTYVVPRSGSTVAVRVPDHEVIRELCQYAGLLATTSANPHGLPAAQSLGEVQEHLGDSIDGVLAGECAFGVASTIIDCTSNPVHILRTGPISFDDIHAVIAKT